MKHMSLMFASCYRKIWGNMDDKGVDQSCYVAGHYDPHYPVPAIRLEVDICKTWDNTIAIFDVDTNEIVEGWI